MIKSATELLELSAQGDGSAAKALMPLIYDELRGLAGQYIRDIGSGITEYLKAHGVQLSHFTLIV